MNLGTQAKQTKNQEQAVLYSRLVVARSLQDSTHPTPTRCTFFQLKETLVLSAM